MQVWVWKVSISLKAAQRVRKLYFIFVLASFELHAGWRTWVLEFGLMGLGKIGRRGDEVGSKI